MASKIEIRPAGRITLVGIEIVLTSIFTAMWFKQRYSWDTYSTLISGVITGLLVAGLFFGLRFFRYVFSIAFSLIWGYLAFRLAGNMTDSGIACWVTFGLITFVSLALHKDYFNFEN